MRKYERQRKILSLIDEYEIETQEELSSLLKENEVEATQATLSRDIKELRLTKVQTPEGLLKYTSVDVMYDSLHERLNKILVSAILTLKANNGRIIIKTLSYAATVVGLALTNKKIKGIAGIIAGHDTIIIEVDERYDARELLKTIERLIY